MMVRMTREFHRSARGPGLTGEDWWTLVLDTEFGWLFVEHEWAHRDMRGGGRADHGVRRMEIAEALAGAVPLQARDTLVVLLGSFFEARAGK